MKGQKPTLLLTFFISVGAVILGGLILNLGVQPLVGWIRAKFG